MQKILSILVALGLLMPLAVSARTIVLSGGTLDCDAGIFTDLLGATSTHSTEICNAGNGNPLAVMQPWGLTGADSRSLVVSSGTVFPDAAGIQYLCPSFYPAGCYNLTSLDYYKNQARQIAQQTNGFGRFNYWLTH